MPYEFELKMRLY